MKQPRGLVYKSQDTKLERRWTFHHDMIFNHLTSMIFPREVFHEHYTSPIPASGSEGSVTEQRRAYEISVIADRIRLRGLDLRDRPMICGKIWKPKYLSIFGQFLKNGRLERWKRKFYWGDELDREITFVRLSETSNGSRSIPRRIVQEANYRKREYED